MELLSCAGYTPIRMQVGMFYTKDLTPVKIGIKGTPDILVLKDNGEVFWIEMKTQKKGSELRKCQDKFHHFLRNKNHRVYIVRSVEEAKEVIECEKRK